MSPNDHVISTPFRLCLVGPKGKIAAVRRFWSNIDEGAEAKAREMLRDAPGMIGFEPWDGSRKIAQERKRSPARRAGS